MPSYGTPRIVEITLIDDDGTKRVATATKNTGNNSNTAHWNLRLTHASGEAWPAQFSGPHILDALGELIERKEYEHNRSRSRGYKPHPMLPDRNVNIDAGGNQTRADIAMNMRDHRFGRR
jgi:hypothetical protein